MPVGNDWFHTFCRRGERQLSSLSRLGVDFPEPFSPNPTDFSFCPLSQASFSLIPCSTADLRTSSETLHGFLLPPTCRLAGIFVAQFPWASLAPARSTFHFPSMSLDPIGSIHWAKVRPTHRASSFAKAPIFAEKLRRGETAGQGIARRKVMGSAVSLTTMTDSLHSHNSNPRNRVKGFASRGLIVLR